MGIDRIGKGAPPPAPEPAAGVEKKEKTFSVDRASAAEARPATQAVDATAPSTALARLRAGEIDVNGYVDLKVDEATRGLEGLSRTELDAIRKVLRDQIATDPGLVDLVRHAAGKAPDVPEE